MLKQFDLNKYISDYDIILLTETFSDKCLNEIFPDYVIFICPGVKISSSVHGRTCGGIALMIRKSLQSFVKQINIEYDNMLAVKVDCSLFGSENDVILLGVYLPPENSDYYSETEIYNGVSMIEDALMDLTKMYENTNFVIFGDLNARVGKENNSVSDNPYSSIPDVLEKDNCIPNKRSSKDIHVNSFGRYLINVCNEFGLSVMNGYNSHFSEDFTYVSKTGCSVIDLFIVSNNVVALCNSLTVLPIVESKHASVTLSMKCNFDRKDSYQENVKFSYQKFKWKKEKSCKFDTELKSECFVNGIKDAIVHIEKDIDMALTKFNKCLYKAGECMKIHVNVNERPKNVWFDLECSQSRKVLRQYLRRVSKFNRDDDRIAYSEKRKEYKKLLVQKEQEKKAKQLNMLQTNLNEPSIFLVLHTINSNAKATLLFYIDKRMV